MEGQDLYSTFKTKQERTISSIIKQNNELQRINKFYNNRIDSSISTNINELIFIASLVLCQFSLLFTNMKSAIDAPQSAKDEVKAIKLRHRYHELQK